MKYIYSLLIFIGLSGSAYADVFQGNFVCETILVSDGSKIKIAMVIDGNSKKEKRLGYDDSWYSKEKLIYRGKYNSFLTFVKENNTIQEDITVITKMTNGSFHYNRIYTAENDRYSGIHQIQSRHQFGLCTKF